VTARASTFAANYKAARDRRFTCECSSGDCSGGGASDGRTAAAAAAAALRVTERQYLRRRVQGRAGQALHLRVQQRRLRPGHAGAVAAAPAGGRRPQPRRLARLASAVQGASHSLHGNTTRATTSRMRGLPDCAPLSSPNIWLDDLQTPATTSCYRRAAKTARPPRRAARSRPTKPRRGPPAHHSAVLRPRGPSAARDASRYGKAYLPEDSGTSGDFAQTRPSPDPPPLHRRDLTRTSSTGAAPTAHPLADTRSARRRGPAARRPAGRFRLISGAVYRSVQPGVRTSCDRLEPQGVKQIGHTTAFHATPLRIHSARFSSCGPSLRAHWAAPCSRRDSLGRGRFGESSQEQRHMIGEAVGSRKERQQLDH
jgi:hypothetical protein